MYELPNTTTAKPFWRDMPGDLATAEMYLSVAAEQVLAYAPPLPYAPPVFEPVTLTWPTGERIDLTRTGDIVTAVCYPRQTAGQMTPATKTLPAGYGVASGDAAFLMNPTGATPSWQVQIIEGSQVIGLFGAFQTSGPYSPNPATVQWLADPAEPVQTLPDNYFLAIVTQARNMANAGVAPVAGGDFDGSGYGVTTFPLDWAVKQMLRPEQGLGAMA